MAWTQTDIDELKKAIALGASSVELPDRKLQLRSLSDMRQTLAMIEAEVGGGRKVRAIRFQTDKGLARYGSRPDGLD